jgi:heme-degrading monooxygenase HmoA
MFARIGTFHSAPEQVDDDVARHAREQMLSRLRQLPGFIGLHVFADRQTGNTIGLSLWETEAALQAWEHMRRPIVAEQIAGTGHTEQESANYELVFSSGGPFLPTAPLTGTAH